MSGKQAKARRRELRKAIGPSVLKQVQAMQAQLDAARNENLYLRARLAELQPQPQAGGDSRPLQEQTV